MKPAQLIFRGAVLLILLILAVGLRLHAQSSQPPEKKPAPKADKAPVLKPLEINNELTEKDDNDAGLNNPCKKFTVKLTKDKTYIIELMSKDFDAFLRLSDKDGNQIAEDDDSGGNLNSLIMHTATKTADHQLTAITLDGKLGKFTLKVREFSLQGEAKPRPVGNGININDQITNKDKSPLAKLGKVYSVEFKAGMTYTIDLASTDFDSYLYLFDGKGKLLEQDDDSGGNLDSRIVYRAEKDGVYHILASNLSGRETGAFALSVRKND